MSRADAGRSRRPARGADTSGDRDAARSAGHGPARDGQPVYPINPMAAARYRDRTSATRRTSGHGDAMVLANMLRTDLPVHRPLPADSELAQAIGVLTRALQDATWQRNRITNELRSLLREFYPAFLTAFAGRTDGLAAPMARRVLELVPSPAAGALLSVEHLVAVLRIAGANV